MVYKYSKRDKANRATLEINGKRVGRVHFREYDAWLNPYKSFKLKPKEEIERFGMRVEENPKNNSFPIKIYVNAYDEEKVASILEKAFCDLY